METFTLVTERSGCGPRLDDKLDAFLKQFAIVRRIGVIGKLLAAGTTHPSRDERPPEIRSIMASSSDRRNGFRP